MKKITVCFFVFLSIALQSFSQREIIDKVVATIGGELILLSEIEEQFALASAQSGNLPDDARCSILDNLLAQKLLLNQAKLDSILITDEEVNVQLDARIDRILSFMNNDVSQFEAYYGQTISEVREEFREDLKNQILTERMRGQVMTDITVTPSEVKEFFDQIPKDSLPYFNSEVEIGEIVYKPKVNSGEMRSSKEKLENIRKRILEDGEDFGELAKTFSDDGSARVGGDLGWAKRGKYVPEFEAAAYSLEENEVSEIVESQFGLHIIQLLERRGNSINVRHILIKPEIKDEDLKKAYNHLDSVRNLIQDDTLNFSIAVKRFSNEDVQSYNNDGRMVNPVTGNTFFEIGDLDPDIYFTIDTMDVNKVSKPFEFTGPDGETYYRIVKLQSRSAPHKANLAQDYSKIQQAAIESKKSKYISDWVEDKLDATYIRVDDLYNNCPNLAKWRKELVRP